MGILSIFLIGIGLSMDAFAVSLTTGLKAKAEEKREIAIKAGLYFGIFQGLMPLIGWMLGMNFNNYIEQIDHWIAFVLLTVIGGKMVYEAFKKDEDEDKNKNNDYKSNKTFLILAIATSIDALAVGISFACLNVNIFTAISIIGVITFILSIIAVYLGKILGSILKSKAELAGGLILILIGFKILLEHLGYM